MFETVMMARAERGAARRRELATDPLLARTAQHRNQGACLEAAGTVAPSPRSRAAPATPAPQPAYARAA